MGKDESIDLSLGNVWRSWLLFKRGKKRTVEFEEFEYYLESNLFKLWQELNSGKYRHGAYRIFFLTDSKRRQIAVASICDRIVHRLVYEYLVKIADKRFIYDAWSCRKGKGLMGAIDRTQKFLTSNSQGWVWRADITKFFDNVDCEILKSALNISVKDKRALAIISKIINSYQTNDLRNEKPKGIPIGNLTSQIFANIYLNEFDRFVKHELGLGAYLRYGDDFILLGNRRESLENYRDKAIEFLREKLALEVNPKSDIMVKVKHGLHFLGTEIFPDGRRLNKRNQARIKKRLTLINAASYAGLIKKHSKQKKIYEFNWRLARMLK